MHLRQQDLVRLNGGNDENGLQKPDAKKNGNGKEIGNQIIMLMTVFLAIVFCVAITIMIIHGL